MLSKKIKKQLLNNLAEEMIDCECDNPHDFVSDVILNGYGKGLNQLSDEELVEEYTEYYYEDMGNDREIMEQYKDDKCLHEAEAQMAIQEMLEVKGVE